jgi:ABC-type transporter Mla subunit MlaD
MTKSSRHFKLGLFVLVGLALLIGGVVALGARTFFQETVAAETYFDESVTGLAPGSAVKVRGVTVGRVQDVRFVTAKYPRAVGPGGLPSRKILVGMAIDAQVISRVGRDVVVRMVDDGLRARLAQAGITGPVYVELEFMDPKVFPPPAIGWTPRDLYVPSAPSTGFELKAAIERVATGLRQVDLAEVIRHADALLVSANRSVDELHVAELRGHAVALLAELRGTNARVKQVVDSPSVDAAVRDLPAITERLRAGLARVDEILHDKRVDRALTGLADTATSAGPAADDVRRLARDLRLLVSSEQDNVRAIVTDLRAVAANLSAVTEDARQNPSRLLLGQPPVKRKPGE